MILENRRNPEYSLYYQAYIFLLLVKQNNFTKSDLLGFFDFYSANYEGRKIPFPRFIFLMHYLFLNEKVEATTNGEIKICC